MKLLSAILILFSLTIELSGQSSIISGIVKNDMGESLDGASIRLKGTDKSTLSDCKGKFKIRAGLGDTLDISKEGYKIGQIEIKKRFWNKIILSFDYAAFREKVEQDTTFSKSFYLGTGQPLFIIDGKHAGDEYYKPIKNELSEEDILSIKIIKEEKVALFGRCGRNGVIWIRTKCGFIPNPSIE